MDRCRLLLGRGFRARQQALDRGVDANNPCGDGVGQGTPHKKTLRETGGLEV
jgi:hypothetical protein